MKAGGRVEFCPDNSDIPQPRRGRPATAAETLNPGGRNAISNQTNEPGDDSAKADFTANGLTTDTKPLKMRKRIGSTTYDVTAYFSNREPLENKIMRLISAELNYGAGSFVVTTPQAGRLPERGCST